MVVSEQFDRLVAPIEGRFRRDELERWLTGVGFQAVAVLSGFGWRVIGKTRGDSAGRLNRWTRARPFAMQ